MKQRFLHWKKVLILGFGVQGRSSKKFLESRVPQIKIDILDEKLGQTENCFSKISETNLEIYDQIICSAGINRTKFLPKKFWSKCTSNSEIFFENCSEKDWEKIVAITGSKGKSSTAKFGAEFLKNTDKRVEIGGNFGTPLLDFWDDFFGGKLDFLVIELSSFQLEFLKISPKYAIFTSFFPDHLRWHGGMEKYFAAKKNIFIHQNAAGFLIAPTSMKNILMREKPASQKVFCPSAPAEFFPENSVISAEHFRANLGTILELGKILKIENVEKIFKKTTKNFRALPHRIELCGEVSGIKFFDDSIATSPDAAAAAIRFFAQNLGVVIVGGQSDGDDFDSFLDDFQSFCTNAKIFICRSEVATEILLAIKKRKNWDDSRHRLFETLEEATYAAFEKIPKNCDHVCLLSPAGKSFDCFENYAARGDFFKNLVIKITDNR